MVPYEVLSGRRRIDTPAAAASLAIAHENSARQVPLPETWGSVVGELRPVHEHRYGHIPEMPEHLTIAPNTCNEPNSLATKITTAQTYLGRLLPGVRTTFFSDKGSTALVLADGERAYKIFRDGTTSYSNVEREMAMLTVLAKEGIAPRPVALIDAAMPYRGNRGQTDLFKGNEPIVRVSGRGHLPVIVTELVDAVPIQEMPAELLAGQFDVFFRALLKHNLILKDCRIQYDQQNNKAIAIDVGEVGHIRHKSTGPIEVGSLAHAQFPDLNAEEYAQALVAKDLLVRFIPPRLHTHIRLRDVATILQQNGLAGIHELLLQHRQIS